MTDSLRHLRDGELRAVLLSRFRERGWAEHTLEVIARADPHSVAAYRFNASPARASDLAPWPADLITALGDAATAVTTPILAAAARLRR
ncbi:hypothetical protein [Streptomyces sp. Wb2n-11]|uniref:hypothetical protein n=1 Tax=Streptomyces sp. Wb2n-11 TaxID=1030533 RepID=UPI000AEF56B6|nr:hypothetical protein [Streptomyces sp. Wb2n-11]